MAGDRLHPPRGVEHRLPLPPVAYPDRRVLSVEHLEFDEPGDPLTGEEVEHFQGRLVREGRTCAGARVPGSITASNTTSPSPTWSGFDACFPTDCGIEAKPLVAGKMRQNHFESGWIRGDPRFRFVPVLRMGHYRVDEVCRTPSPSPGRPGADPAHEPRERKQGETVGEHQEELVGHLPTESLKEELQRRGGSEQERRQTHPRGMPASEYHDGDGDEPSTRRHLLGERTHLGQHQGGARPVRRRPPRSASPRPGPRRCAPPPPAPSTRILRWPAA